MKSKRNKNKDKSNKYNKVVRKVIRTHIEASKEIPMFSSFLVVMAILIVFIWGSIIIFAFEKSIVIGVISLITLTILFIPADFWMTYGLLKFLSSLLDGTLNLYDRVEEFAYDERKPKADETYQMWYRELLDSDIDDLDTEEYIVDDDLIDYLDYQDEIPEFKNHTN